MKVFVLLKLCNFTIWWTQQLSDKGALWCDTRMTMASELCCPISQRNKMWHQKHGIPCRLFCCWKPSVVIFTFLCILEVPSSNLGPETGYIDWGISLFSSAPPVKSQGGITLHVVLKLRMCVSVPSTTQMTNVDKWKWIKSLVVRSNMIARKANVAGHTS